MLEPSCSLLGMVFSYWRLLRWCSLALYYIFIIIVIDNTLKGDKTTCRLRGSSTSQAHSHRSGTMSLHPQSSWIVPEQTARVAKAVLPKSNRDYQDLYKQPTHPTLGLSRTICRIGSSTFAIWCY